MAQHDFNIDNQSAPAFRGDLNNALEALGTLSSGATAPATTYANMLWYDTANNILKMRSEADDAWIDLGTLDQSANTFAPAGVAELTRAQAEDDTSTVFGQVSGQRLAQAVAANETPQSAPSTSEVLTATAGATTGAVGTYAMLKFSTNTNASEGSTHAGSNLLYSSAGATVIFSTSPSGTWRLLGRTSSVNNETSVSVFLRIS